MKPKLHPIVCAMALAAAGSTSHAVVNGFDPASVPATVPQTAVATPNWKFVGKITGSASAIQVAPRWIMASRHATPPVGSTFTNAFGTATVASCVFPTPTYTPTFDDDHSLCRLNSVITPTAGTAFPAVTGFDRPGVFSFSSIEHWGTLLGIGFSGGVRRAAWNTFAGLPPDFDGYDISLNPASIYVDLPLPQTANGDSGGAAYFYPSGSATGALVGVLTGQSTVGGSPSYFTPGRAQWITQTIAAQGDQAPAFAPIGSLLTDTTSRLPRYLATGSVTAAVTGATAATLTWPTPPADPSNAEPVTRYLVRLQYVGQQGASIVVRANPGSYTFNGLVDGRQYQGCVLTGNALGYGSNVKVRSLTRIERPGCVSFVAGAPNVPQLDGDYETPYNAATGKTNLRVKWLAPVSNGVSIGSYVATVKVWSTANTHINGDPAIRTTTIQTPNLSFALDNVLSGREKGCITITARSVTQVSGPALDGLCFLAAKP